MKTIEQHPQIIKKYNKPFLFYLLSIVIPWTFWFLSAWLSHKTPYTKSLELATGLSGFIGLLAPFVVALCFILPDKELRNDFLSRFFNFSKIRREYYLIAFFLMLLSILAAQAVSLLFGYSSGQFQLRGSFTFHSAVFPVWFLLLAAPALEEMAWHSYGTCLLYTSPSPRD